MAGTWTYAGDPANSDKDAVRFELGDTNIDDQLVTDEEIAYALTTESNVVLRAAALLAEALCGFFSRDVNFKNSRLKVDAGDRAANFKALAKRLWARAGVAVSEDGRRAIAAGELFAGGLSIADKRAFANDTDLIQNVFSRGMDDHPKSASDTTFNDIVRND